MSSSKRRSIKPVAGSMARKRAVRYSFPMNGIYTKLSSGCERMGTGFIPGLRLNGPGFKDSSKPSALRHARRILIAEDDDIIRQIISNVLADEGYAVNAAADGEQAWMALRQDPYDLLVTDNEMPRLTGINLIERIRQAGMSLPVIVASSAFPVDRAWDYPQLQITAVIPKPFSRLKFLATVKSVLSSNEDSLADHAPLNQSPTSPLSIL